MFIRLRYKTSWGKPKLILWSWGSDRYSIASCFHGAHLWHNILRSSIYNNLLLLTLTYLLTYLPTHLPTYLPTYVPMASHLLFMNTTYCTGFRFKLILNHVFYFCKLEKEASLITLQLCQEFMGFPDYVIPCAISQKGIYLYPQYLKSETILLQYWMLCYLLEETWYFLT